MSDNVVEITDRAGNKVVRVSTRGKKRRKPIEFVLEGDYLEPPEPPDGYNADESGPWDPFWSESFITLPGIPAGAIDALQGTISSDGEGGRVYHTPSLVDFMTNVLPDKDVKRFLTTINDKNKLVEGPELGKLLMAVVEELGKDRSGES